MKRFKGKNFSSVKGEDRKDAHLTVKQFLFLASISVFIITQVLLYSINFNKLFFKDTDDFTRTNKSKDLLTGDIFFTGDTFGKYGLVGCDRLGSISRRAKILKKFDDYLYLDFGNFTLDNEEINKSAVPILLKAYQYMDLKVMNLTKRDLLNLAEMDIDLEETRDISFISANLRLTAPYQPSDSNENMDRLEKMISTHHVISLWLRNNEEIKQILVGITGISNNERKLHKGKIRFKIKDIRQSLEQVIPLLEKVDLKILLFNETFFELKKLLMDENIRFDLVIAYPTLPGHINAYINIKNTPVVFTDDYGRSLGHVRVCKINNGYTFKFNWYELGMGIPEDDKVENLTRLISKRITYKKNIRKSQEPGPAGKNSENIDEE